MARLFISAAHKSSGKTTVSIGLAAAWSALGLKVQTFKKGPDYIDPMWLARASGRPCFNLDFNTQTHAEITASVEMRAANADLALIEGNKGLYDGVDVGGTDSSAALARLTAAPVILVIDVLGMTRGIAPLVLGYQNFDRDLRIAGVVLNKVGPARQETKLRQALERYTDLPVLGAIPRDQALLVKERHLGLMTPAEALAWEIAIEKIRRSIESCVDLDRLLTLSRTAITAESCAQGAKQPIAHISARTPTIRIAVARDAAFGFYYPDDLEAFERAGATLCFFDALNDTRLPDADGLFIGGGFPETQAERLSANAALRADIARQLRAGLPAYAECGGLMYLTRSIRWQGHTHEMVGFIPADTVMHDRPQGRGLVILEETPDMPWPHSGPEPRAARIQAHEFHYAALENLGAGLRFAYRVRRGSGIADKHDGIILGNLLASFSHLRSSQANPWIERFVNFVRRRKISTESAADSTIVPRQSVNSGQNSHQHSGFKVHHSVFVR
jgi:cobyrinic acid a,c-diamide synthase